MNLPRARSVFHRARTLCRSTVTPSRFPTPGRLRVVIQTYATQSGLNTNSKASGSKLTSASLLSSALDQRQRAANHEDSAGPFTLGLTPPRLGEVKPEKKWSELSVGGKAVRTTSRTGNMLVVAAGAGLVVVVVYALTSEALSPNSPTVMYNKACDLIKASPQVHQYMQEPLIFHNHPPSVSRPRHRNHYVSSQIFLDSTGREHMLLNFYVQGRPPGSTGPYSVEGEGILSRWSRKAQDAVVSLRRMSADEMKEEAARRGQRLVDKSKELFKFLTGEENAASASQPVAVPEPRAEKEQKGWMSSVTGLFSGIKGATRSGSSSSEASSGSAFTEGEVHADLVMNDEGYYEFRYLLIDMPNSNTRNPRRVFVQRQNGVQESEPIVRWHR